MSKTAAGGEIPKTYEEAIQFLKRAEAGDAATLPLLRRWLQEPGAVEHLGGNLARLAEGALLDSIADKNLPFREAMAPKPELMRQELAGPDPSPVERLLVEWVVACWLQVQHADAIHAQAQKNCTMSQSNYHQRRMDRAPKRFLSAVRTLALVRRPALPVLLKQVNVAARQQVNTGTGTNPGQTAGASGKGAVRGKEQAPGSRPAPSRGR